MTGDDRGSGRSEFDAHMRAARLAAVGKGLRTFMLFNVARHQAGLIVIDPQLQDSKLDRAAGAPHDTTLTDFLTYLATHAPESVVGEASSSTAAPTDSSLLVDRFQYGRSAWLRDGRLSANVRGLARELELALAHTRRAIAQAR